MANIIGKKWVNVGKIFGMTLMELAKNPYEKAIVDKDGRIIAKFHY